MSLARRPTLLAGLSVFTVSAVVCLFAPTVEVLVAVRFVQGAAAAFGLAIPNAMVTDYARDRQAARLFSWIVIIGGVAPLVASLTGAQMLRLLGWRGPFWMICLAALVGSSIVCSIALVLTTQQRWARIAALAVAGGLPAAAAVAMFVMFLGALGLAFSGGRLQ